MSYSYTVDLDPTDTVADRIAEAVAALPDETRPAGENDEPSVVDLVVNWTEQFEEIGSGTTSAKRTVEVMRHTDPSQAIKLAVALRRGL